LELELSENNQLRLKVEVEMSEGRNLLSQMAERTRTHIKRAQRKLNHLRQVSEVDADERFSLNVSMFR
jgi:DNA-directed RNA polymerase subunit F